MKAPRETDLIRACLRLLKLRGVFAWRNNTTGVYDPARGRFRTFTGLKGVADILGVLPGGRLLAVEGKMPGNRPTRDQQAFLDGVRRAGGAALVVHSVEELERALRELGG